MKSFHVADLSASGDLRATQAYDYSTLERIPGCTEMMATLSNYLYRDANEFDCSLSSAGVTKDEIGFRWRASAPTAGIATIRAERELASLSILATGLDASADAITLHAFQNRITQELHDTGFEPAFGLLSLTERPLVATMTFQSPRSETARLLVALADRCFAASYFRYHQLA